MKIGITCYPTFGGSGVVATELGIALAERGDEVHFISYALPSRLDLPRERVHFHEVVAPSYPLFVSPPYTLALATKMAEVAAHCQLDLLHVHYALPHAISAILAREMGNGNGVRLKVVTTLHGTDITIVGQDRSYLPITRWGIDQSDAVTAVSRYLKDVTVREFGVRRQIDVVPNFVDTQRYRPDGASPFARALARDGEALLVHVSNFRPVKRIRRRPGDLRPGPRRTIPARLLLIGDGPDRSLAERLAREGGFEDQTTFLGNVAAIETILPAAQLLLLPSDAESFGLAALEAMACGVPGHRHGGRRPARSRRGRRRGLPPAGRRRRGHGRRRARLIEDQALWQRFSAAAPAPRRATSFRPTDSSTRYRELYEKTLSG